MASHKIAKNGPADEIELSVAQALFDLENNVNDLKKDLKALQISSAKELLDRIKELSTLVKNENETFISQKD
ncbi:hypothetical protein BGZ76_000215 [Entomortierella beljakovae]|nr:hypothetical protein BGZ76_000215 [Entomortierella beljakovae]